LLDKKLPITCPLCGRKSEFALEDLKEGAPLQCPKCQVKLNLHGHMWEEIQSDIAKMRQEK
jgi:DNA-directed RNA polymerase subunit RPC12/RpoP